MRIIAVAVILSAALFSKLAYAVWDYSIAAQVAILDGTLATCGKIEPRLTPILSKELADLAHVYDTKTVLAARKSREYKDVYRAALYEHLKYGWGDPEEEAHACESVYINLTHNDAKPDQWWRDRLCVNVAADADPEAGQRCASGPRAKVAFENIVPDATISILRVVPSSDLSFPGAGPFPQSYTPGDRVASSNEQSNAWAIPESVRFEWKEWPRAFPAEPGDARGLDSVRSYVDQVRGKVQRKYAELTVRGRIPSEVLAEALRNDQLAEPGKSIEPSLKLFFIFTQSGLRFRWEQWNGNCIKNFGGDEIDLPRNRLLSGDWICAESELETHDSHGKLH